MPSLTKIQHLRLSSDQRNVLPSDVSPSPAVKGNVQEWIPTAEMRYLNSLRTLVKHQTLRQHCSNWANQLVQSHPSIPMRCTSYTAKNDCSLRGINIQQYFHTPFRAGIRRQTTSVSHRNKLYLLLPSKRDADSLQFFSATNTINIASISPQGSKANQSRKNG